MKFFTATLSLLFASNAMAHAGAEHVHFFSLSVSSAIIMSVISAVVVAFAAYQLRSKISGLVHKLISRNQERLGVKKASAHCDIPCKIYDPSTAQIAVLTMIRLVDIIEEMDASAPLSINQQAKLTRLINEKEAHGLKVKEEVRVIWGDYFKAPQFEKFPGTHDLVHKIMLQASKAKQEVSRADAVALLDLVNEFAESFWATKGVDTYKAVCPYPPALEVVYPKLG